MVSECKREREREERVFVRERERGGKAVVWSNSKIHHRKNRERVENQNLKNPIESNRFKSN